MALTSVFYDGVVTESDRAKNLAGAPEYGVYGVSDFAVKAHPSIPYAVLVTKGKAHGHGVTDTAVDDQVVQCASLASGTRWDLIAVRRNWQPLLGGPSELVVIQAGDIAEIPAARKNDPGVEDDQPIALVKWVGGLSAPQQFIDLRLWPSAGGMFAVSDLVRTYLKRIGTRVKIAGTIWSNEIGANDSVAWINEFGSGPWINLEMPGGWVSHGICKARLIHGGAFIQVAVDARYASGSSIAEGWIIANLPAGLRPLEGTFVPGTTNSYNSGTFYIVSAAGISVGPRPIGTIVQLNGIAPMR